jgi:hypothetical protein
VPVEVQQGFKFAVIAVPESRGGTSPTPLLRLSNGYAVSPDLPSNALDTWQESIGRFHREELEECRLFLWSVAQSTAPEVLDDENKELCRSAFRLFLGVLIGVPYFSGGRLTQLTGANSDGTARVRQMTGFHRTYYTKGAPAPALSAAKMRLAAQLAKALHQLEQSPHKQRIERSVRTFREACESHALDQRLHQFVRCAEALAAPWNGTEFTKRMSSVCAGRCQSHLRQLYQIRSAVEHLHGPFARLPGRIRKEERQQFLQMRTVQAEALAHYVLTTILMNQSLWPHFRDRKTIDAFWKLPARQFNTLWPGRLAFPAILRAYDATADSQAP